MSDASFDVGARLKELRLSAKMSQRDLAGRAGVPHAQISNIEQNKTSPSVSTLRKILTGLDMGLADFFEEDRVRREGPFFSSEDLIDLTSRVPANAEGQGLLLLRQIGDAKAYNLQILHEEYAPGADTGETRLQHLSTEGGYVVEGEIEITVGDEVKILRAGESYLFDSRIPHRFRNVSGGKAVVISACTPPYL